MEKLRAKQVVSCGDLQSISLAELQKEFGKKNGAHLYDVCRGKDDRKLKSFTNRKSVSCDVNYGIRLETVSLIQAFFFSFNVNVIYRNQNCSNFSIIWG